MKNKMLLIFAFAIPLIGTQQLPAMGQTSATPAHVSNSFRVRGSQNLFAVRRLCSVQKQNAAGPENSGSLSFCIRNLARTRRELSLLLRMVRRRVSGSIRSSTWREDGCSMWRSFRIL